MDTRLFRSGGFVLALFALYLSAPILAAVPATIPFQAALKSAGGTLVNGPVSVTFSLYTSATGGSPVWTETQALTAVNGQVIASLGSITSFSSASVSFAQPYFVGIKAGADAEMAPRVPLGSVPYALSAWNMGGNAGTDGSQFMGTSDNQAFEVRVNNVRAARFLPTSGAPTVIFGDPSNKVVDPVGQGDTISGGGNNLITAAFSFVGGGFGNTAGPGSYSTAVAGQSNLASGPWATVGGGQTNQATATEATVGGGTNNIASGNDSVVGGGLVNMASGGGSVVPGGLLNVAAGAYSLAAGQRAQANHTGAYVWSDDSSASPFVSTAINQYLIRATGGVGINKNNPGSELDVNGRTTTVDFTMSGTSPATGSILTATNAIGAAAWASPTAALGGTAWLLGGNAGTNPATQFVGTTDNQSLVVNVNGTQAVRYEPTAATPNIIGGFSGNTVAAGITSATIAGGGAAGSINSVNASYATVGGGIKNTAGGFAATISGGATNTVTGDLATVGGGNTNTAGPGQSALVAGGESNTAAGYAAAVGGGLANSAPGFAATVGGGSTNGAAGDRSTVGGGYANVAGPGVAAVIAGGEYNAAGGQESTVGGGSTNNASGVGSAVAGGVLNKAQGLESTVAGGISNTASGATSTVGGGTTNKATGASDTVGGGSANTANFSFATVGGGSNNLANGDNSTISGGSNGVVGSGSTLGGGLNNFSNGPAATVGGGSGNSATNQYSTVAGGDTNKAGGDWSAVGGGAGNSAIGPYAVIGGGTLNVVNALGQYYGTIGGGYQNTITSDYTTIGGGSQNSASGVVNTIAGGSANTAAGYISTIGGGSANTANGQFAVVAGGYGNTANDDATVSGGYNNTASGVGAAIPGGNGNIAAGPNSFAGGQGAIVGATHEGTFVWAGQSGAGATFASTTPNQFLVRAFGGVGINMNAPAYTLDVAGTGHFTGNINVAGTTYTSDARFKQNIDTVRDPLETVLNLRGVTFDWRRDEFPNRQFASGRQIGFIAQEVEQVLPELVSTEPDGYKSVAYANVVPVLVEAVKTLKAENDALRAEKNTEVAALRKQNAAVEARLQRLERLMTRSR